MRHVVEMEPCVVAEFLNFLKYRSAFQSSGGDAGLAVGWLTEHNRFTPELLEAACQ